MPAQSYRHGTLSLAKIQPGVNAFDICDSRGCDQARGKMASGTLAVDLAH